jgi:hypothetical protein
MATSSGTRSPNCPQVSASRARGDRARSKSPPAWATATTSYAPDGPDHSNSPPPAEPGDTPRGRPKARNQPRPDAGGSPLRAPSSNPRWRCRRSRNAEAALEQMIARQPPHQLMIHVHNRSAPRHDHAGRVHHGNRVTLQPPGDILVEEAADHPVRLPPPHGRQSTHVSRGSWNSHRRVTA